MTGLVVQAAAAVRAPKGREPADDPAVLGYFQDLLRPFGAEPDKELLQRGAQVHHQDLADLLAEADGVRESRPQLLVVAHALPDVVPFTAVAPYLTSRLGGEATCFAIGQQGLAAPFTALRIASAYRRAGRVREVVLAILEQTTLPTSFPLVEDVPLADSAAALVLGAGPADGAGPALAGVAAGVPLDTLLTAGPGHPGPSGTTDTLVVLGSWATQDPPQDVAVHRAAPGSYCTGVWLELAENWVDWRERYGRIVLSDTDPRTGRSHHAVFTTGLAPEPAADGGR
ncbi:hypothetical protein ACWD5R_22975 [Streptomyces sp. NPDC002514]|uniref:hypothetical protein n=1 Tax=unclassified Streptomyces TaxID=2593676 RepID=UPI0036B6298C